MWGLTACNIAQDAPTFGLRMPVTTRRRARATFLGPRAMLRPGTARPKPAPVVTEYWMMGTADETGTRVLGASAFKLQSVLCTAGWQRNAP